MFYSDLFSLSRANARRHMDEVACDVTIVIDFLLGEKALSWQPDLLIFLHIAHHKARVSVVSTNDFVELDVIFLDLGAG